MDRWQGKVAVVTGASCGIGEAIARDLHREGMIVVALARRENRLEDIRNSLPEEERSRFHVKCCDVTDEEQVKAAFGFVESELGGVDVLVNNAGTAKPTELVKLDNTADIRLTLETNVMGVVFCTREAFNSMKERGIDGHVVIINSIAGHNTPNIPELPSFNIYPATKHALTSMTEVYRQEFMRHGTKIRITSVSPGVVDTEIFPDHLIDIIRANMEMLAPKDVSGAVLYALAAPPNVQIHDVIIKPVGEKL
ncbi:farnesol dehydrogenase-like [Episyrphus balteatus]|uniref:farnesol dehydrogenase-like n=1 Tax=Episyrphus balteatus TaxID=286459 RepID=UPI00248580D1|nr:farnesol dehydrogenase-like [Episyrphus balteatus]